MRDLLRNGMILFIFSTFSTYGFSQVLAKVGEKSVTKKYFQQKYDEVKKNTFNYPSPKVFLEDLIRFEVGLQEAKKRGFEKDPIVIDRYNQELYKALIEKEIGKKVQGIRIKESELKRYYSKRPELRTSHILIQFKPDATPKQIAIAKKRADEIYAEVRKSKRKFADLVRLYSDDNLSKKNGGDLGFQSSLSLSSPYYIAARKLKFNRISRPVRTRFGFHIIKLTGIQKFADAHRGQVRAAVFDEKRKVIFDNYFKKLKRKYSIKTFNSEVNKLKK